MSPDREQWYSADQALKNASTMQWATMERLGTQVASCMARGERQRRLRKTAEAKKQREDIEWCRTKHTTERMTEEEAWYGRGRCGDEREL